MPLNLPSGPGLVFSKACLRSSHPANPVKASGDADQAGALEPSRKISPSPDLVKFRLHEPEEYQCALPASIFTPRPDLAASLRLQVVVLWEWPFCNMFNSFLER